MLNTADPNAMAEVLIVDLKAFGDAHGFFFESSNQRNLDQAMGLRVQVVQDNHSRCVKGVLRGLHYQIQHPQGKMARVTQGEGFDVVVDIHRHSPNFGKWDGVLLSDGSKRQLWMSPGFFHGSSVASDSAELLYETTDYRDAEFELSLLWSDPALGVHLPIPDQLRLAAKDAAGTSLVDGEMFA